jgi:hypothetical protein
MIGKVNCKNIIRWASNKTDIEEVCWLWFDLN